MATQNIQVGDKIYVCRFGSWQWFYRAVEVVNKTKAGYIDVRFQPGQEQLTRFRPDGKEQGGYHGYEIDDIPFAEREAKLAQEKREKEAAGLLRQHFGTDSVNPNATKETLQGAVAQLQKKLDEAKALVEAI